MAVNPATTVRKLVSMPKELWARAEDFRFEKRIKSEADALRQLIEAGLEKLTKPKKK